MKSNFSTQNKFIAVGIMSGTSLDGVDLACCAFKLKNKKWNYKILKAETIPYSLSWKKKLNDVASLSAYDFALTDREYGKYLGELVRKFLSQKKFRVDFVSSHGHTIFHQPEKMLTAQIGSGAAIAAACDLPVVNDFRSLDVAYKGQGAPLVPIGDELLFPKYDFCLNLGGIANISFRKKKSHIAFDICPVNIVLNALSEKLGKPFDRDGNFASKGKVNETLFRDLNRLKFYSEKSPKSLGKEWIDRNIFPLLSKSKLGIHDQLCTLCEHIAFQIGSIISSEKKSGRKILVTGGGALNKFLMERISFHTSAQIIIPDPHIINYKEALIFAFLGVLRMRNEINVIKSVTGAQKSTVSGAVHLS